MRWTFPPFSTYSVALSCFYLSFLTVCVNLHILSKLYDVGFFSLNYWCLSLSFFLSNVLFTSVSTSHHLIFSWVGCITCSVSPVWNLRLQPGLLLLTQQLVPVVVPVCGSGENRWCRRAQAVLTVSHSLHFTLGLFEIQPFSLRFPSSLCELQKKLAGGKKFWHWDLDCRTSCLCIFQFLRRFQLFLLVKVKWQKPKSLFCNRFSWVILFNIKVKHCLYLFVLEKTCRPAHVWHSH